MRRPGAEYSFNGVKNLGIIDQLFIELCVRGYGVLRLKEEDLIQRPEFPGFEELG